MACNVTRMKEHLKNCMAYPEDLTNEASWIVEKHNQKKQKIGIQTFVSVIEVKRQSKLEVLAMSSQEQEIVYRIAVIAFCKIRGVFNSFDDEEYSAFINRLNLIYKLLIAQLFSRPLLDDIYDNVQ